MINKRSFASLALAFAVSAGAGCATTTMITSDPPGAKVTGVDEKGTKKELGVTPYKYETSMWIWQSEKVEVTSASGDTQTVELKRSEFDMLPGVGGIALTCCTGVGACAGIPIFLAGGFKLPEKTDVKFTPKKGFFRDSDKESAPVAYLSPRLAADGSVVY